MNVMGEGNRKPGPLEIERDVDFASMCRMEVRFVSIGLFDQEKGFPSNCSQTHFHRNEKPAQHLLACLH